jgi:DNA-binding NtrC family response regulator
MCRQAVDRHLAAREWVVLRGEPGSGRRTLARAAHAAHSPGARLRVVDPHEAGTRWPAEVAAELVRRDGTLVVTDVDRLGPSDATRLMDLLEPHRWSTVRDRPWVVLTVGARRPDDAVARLVERFPATVDVPPLRHHGEDVPELVTQLLAGLGHTRLSCSPEAMRVLTRCHWPGNVGQLRDVLGRVVARRRSGIVQVRDLPADVFVGVRHLLTPVEALECDAIVGALRQTGGSKTKAARLIGMSRATVYRKVREYGISLPDEAPGLAVPSV